ncbi:MAG: hypothetical protein EOP01_02155 [Propionibacteriaceae bacterium]|nr:MAG: hypothetical protein EOP01_02155 [Propionibacteriaceae bacterium]
MRLRPFEHLIASLQFCPLLIIPVWSSVRLWSRARAGRWRRPGWFAEAGCTSFYLLALAWMRGFLAGGLRTDKDCLVHHQHYDEAFREAHHAELFRLFPLTNPCNATYDLVPAWVNPAVVVFGALLMASAVGLASTCGRPSRRPSTPIS